MVIPPGISLYQSLFGGDDFGGSGRGGSDFGGGRGGGSDFGNRSGGGGAKKGGFGGGSFDDDLDDDVPF